MIPMGHTRPSENRKPQRGPGVRVPCSDRTTKAEMGQVLTFSRRLMNNMTKMMLKNSKMKVDLEEDNRPPR